VSPTQIVPADIKSDGGFQVVELLAEGVHQPRESAQVHPKIQIRSFDVARANVPQVRVATNWGWDRLDNLGRAVPVRAGVVRLSVKFDELREEPTTKKSGRLTVEESRRISVLAPSTFNLRPFDFHSQPRTRHLAVSQLGHYPPLLTIAVADML